MQKSIISASVLEGLQAVVIRNTRPQLKKGYFCIASSSSDVVLTLNKILFPPQRTVRLSAPVIHNSWGIQMQMSTEETFYSAEGAVLWIHFHTWTFIFCVKSFGRKKERMEYCGFLQRKPFFCVFSDEYVSRSNFLQKIWLGVNIVYYQIVI